MQQRSLSGYKLWTLRFMVGTLTHMPQNDHQQQLQFRGSFYSIFLWYQNVQNFQVCGGTRAHRVALISFSPTNFLQLYLHVLGLPQSFLLAVHAHNTYKRKQPRGIRTRCPNHLIKLLSVKPATLWKSLTSVTCTLNLS